MPFTLVLIFCSKCVFQVQLQDNGNILEVKVQHYGDLVPVVRRRELLTLKCQSSLFCSRACLVCSLCRAECIPILFQTIDNAIDNSSYRLIFYLDKKDEIYHYSSKEHPKISKIAKFNWLRHFVKYGKYSHVKLAHF
jgi:hypothetical protein